MKELLDELRDQIEKTINREIVAYVHTLERDYDRACENQWARREISCENQWERCAYIHGALSGVSAALADLGKLTLRNPIFELLEERRRDLDTFARESLTSARFDESDRDYLRGAADGVRGLISVIDEAMERCGSGLFPGATAEPSFEDAIATDLAKGPTK